LALRIHIFEGNPTLFDGDMHFIIKLRPIPVSERGTLDRLANGPRTARVPDERGSYCLIEFAVDGTIVNRSSAGDEAEGLVRVDVVVNVRS
jgi:hypothetical protein